MGLRPRPLPSCAQRAPGRLGTGCPAPGQTFLAPGFPLDRWEPGAPQWALGRGCLPLRMRPSCTVHSSFPSPPPSRHSFRLGSVHAPTWSPLGCPLPQFCLFRQRDFCLGLDREQGPFEWLVEDWGHGEGQGQERGGSVLVTSWTPGDPQHHCRAGEEGCRNQARERVLWGGWSAGQGKGVWRSRLCWGCLLGAGRTDPPLLSREGQRGSNVHPVTCFFYVIPSGNFSIPGPS